MQTLNLPSFKIKLKNKHGQDFIFDEIRMKYVQLTPEEWVRQHVIHYLRNILGYPKGLIKVETGVGYNTRMKRTDIIVYSRQVVPFILVECKAPTVAINQATLEQAAMYNKTLKAPIVFLTNGLVHYCFSIGKEGNIESLDFLPRYSSNK